MMHEIVLAAIGLLTGAFQLSKAVLELLRQVRVARDGGEGDGKSRRRPRHLK